MRSYLLTAYFSQTIVVITDGRIVGLSEGVEKYNRRNCQQTFKGRRY
jgi:hypothetical protein